MEKPVCVDVCPTKALEVIDLSEVEALLREKRRKTAQEMANSAGEGLRLLDVKNLKNKELINQWKQFISRRSTR